MSAGSILRNMLKSEQLIFTAGVYSPVQARLAEMAGLKCIYLSGYSASIGYLLKPDIGFLNLTDMVFFAGLVARAVKSPVISDADDAYGNAVTATRTVEEFSRAGVAAIHIEDQRFPKRCGHLAGKLVLPFDEALLKLKSIIRARDEVAKDMLIIARTDVLGSGGGTLEEAVRRGVAFADAGADVVWAEFRSPDDSAADIFADEVLKKNPDVPLLFNYSSSFKWSKSSRRLRFRELSAKGYRIVLVSMGALQAELLSVWKYLKSLACEEEEAQWRLEAELEATPFENLHEFVGLSRYAELERLYLPGGELKERYG
ncbi:MAG: isocitrate lyase/PEP mutase family protein [Nitrososphaerota archaeon]|nr:isocitrate lyase/PEP mutase family protein [Candidatus Calditenuaceae archaeon]MDW8073274.1 isocitrate lyase/PEP mutase family protein [Nitrososphaerota archaeon]